MSKNAQKTLRMGPQNHQKIDKIQAWASQGPSLCPPMSQDRPRIVPAPPQDRPRVPQDAKVEAPSMPNDIHGYQNPPKINKNQGLDLKVLFCCLLCSPMSQNWPRVPQHAKVKQPIMPNDRFAYQRCQDALATMPRICNPEAMGNDRGPAAEGVAHKISFVFS